MGFKTISRSIRGLDGKPVTHTYVATVTFTEVKTMKIKFFGSSTYAENWSVEEKATGVAFTAQPKEWKADGPTVAVSVDVETVPSKEEDLSEADKAVA